MTLYTVLRDADDVGLWDQLAEVDATSAARAIRAAAGDNEGAYVAVPSRSWKPLNVKVEKTTRVTVK